MSQSGTSTGHHDDHDDHDEGYRGSATLTVDDVEYDVTVTLLGHVEPLDGRFRWYGRVAAHAELHAELNGRKRPARVVTPVGAADGELSDVDPWGRYRIAGISTPPFSVEDPVGVAGVVEGTPA